MRRYDAETQRFFVEVRTGERLVVKPENLLPNDIDDSSSSIGLSAPAYPSACGSGPLPPVRPPPLEAEVRNEAERHVASQIDRGYQVDGSPDGVVMESASAVNDGWPARSGRRAHGSGGGGAREAQAATSPEAACMDEWEFDSPAGDAEPRGSNSVEPATSHLLDDDDDEDYMSRKPARRSQFADALKVARGPRAKPLVGGAGAGAGDRSDEDGSDIDCENDVDRKSNERDHASDEDDRFFARGRQLQGSARAAGARGEATVDDDDWAARAGLNRSGGSGEDDDLSDDGLAAGGGVTVRGPSETPFAMACD